MVSRRNFLSGSGGVMGGALGMAMAARPAFAASGSDDWPADPPFRFDGDMTDFDAAQAALLPLYDVRRDFATFDAAYYGVMTRPVQAAYRARSEWVLSLIHI